METQRIGVFPAAEPARRARRPSRASGEATLGKSSMGCWRTGLPAGFS